MNDRQAAQLVRNRDERAINYIINKYSRLLWKVASAALADLASEEELEECVADVFIQFWQQPESFDPEKGQLKSWLCIIARSRARDRYRLLSRLKTEELTEGIEQNSPSPEAALINHEDNEQLKKALAMLTETDREIIRRRYFSSQKPAEIALAMDLSVKQVTNRLHRAKQKLKDYIEEKGV